MLVKVKVSSLVLDYDLYPREDVQSYNVSAIVEALNAGVALPPIVVDKKSKRVVDGFHRIKAYQRKYGPNVKIPCIMKEYTSEAEMFLDAMRLNSCHGRALSVYDRVRCISRAEALKMDVTSVASALNMTVETLNRFKSERLGYFHSQPVALKRTTMHLSGEELTEEQVSYNRQAGGMASTFYINQLIKMLESESIELNNEKVVKGLKRLYDLLGKVLGPIAV